MTEKEKNKTIIEALTLISQKSNVSLDKILTAYLALGPDFLQLFNLLAGETITFIPLPKNITPTPDTVTMEVTNIP